MATYRLTIGSETRNGTNNADTFDGYKFDDGFGETGGTDILSGRGGDDLFLLATDTTPVDGLIDGGADIDTVRAYGFDLGQLDFQNVEVLSVEAFEFSATIAQLNSFETITSSNPDMSRIKFYLNGTGGVIDVSGQMAPGKSIEFNAIGLGSGYDATGTALADVFLNSNFSDTVHGGLGADTIQGVYRDTPGGGTDLLFGDGGADTFSLRRQSGTVDGGAGNDTVVAFQFTSGFGSRLGDLGDATFVNVERLVTGANITLATAAQLNSFATITGGDADKLIKFDLSGGPGGVIDFSTKLKLAGEHVWLRAHDATSAVDVTGTAGDDLLTGSDFNDRLTGGDGDDYLGGAGFSFGAQGRDTLIGGAGDDTYYVDGSDRLVELVGPAGGVDTVISTVSCNLANLARFQGEFENLTLNGYLGAEHPDINGYGNGLNNVITGNDGDNRLDGRTGADTMIGNGGDDTFVVDDANDVVEEIATENDGTDRVLSSVDFDLAATTQARGFIENLTLTGTASIDAFGNELANRLTGNSGDNVIDGREGRDTMTGQAGNDTYYVDQTADVVVELDGGGIDTVFTSVSYNLGGRFIENVFVTGGDNANIVGNQLNNAIVGNDARNVITGGLGADTLTGGGDFDTFIFNAPLADANADFISDFDVTQDRIRLDDAIFTELAGLGTLTAAEFAYTTDGQATDADDRIIYNETNGRLYYDADGDGAGQRQWFASITQFTTGLTNADFFLA